MRLKKKKKKRISRALQKTGAMDPDNPVPLGIQENIDLTEDNIFGDLEQNISFSEKGSVKPKSSERKRRPEKRKSEGVSHGTKAFL